MLPYGRFSLTAIALIKGVNDRFMFGHRLAQPPAKFELQAPKGLETTVQAQAFLLEKTVAGLAIEGLVKNLVLEVVTIGVVLLNGVLATLIDRPETSQSRIGDANGGKSDANSLQFRHDLKHLQKLDGPRMAYKDTTSWNLFHQSG